MPEPTPHEEALAAVKRGYEPMERTGIAWHYTIAWPHLMSIIVAGQIRPATMMLAPRERPAVWLTSYEHYEPTARKGYDLDGTCATLEEMADMFGGLVRLGVATSKLTKWNAAARAAVRMPERVWRTLEQSATEAGSDPSLWWIHIGSIQLARVDALEFYDLDTDTWHPTEFGPGGVALPVGMRERIASLAAAAKERM